LIGPLGGRLCQRWSSPQHFFLTNIYSQNLRGVLAQPGTDSSVLGENNGIFARQQDNMIGGTDNRWQTTKACLPAQAMQNPRVVRASKSSRKTRRGRWPSSIFQSFLELVAVCFELLTLGIAHAAAVAGSRPVMTSLKIIGINSLFPPQSPATPFPIPSPLRGAFDQRLQARGGTRWPVQGVGDATLAFCTGGPSRTVPARRPRVAGPH